MQSRPEAFLFCFMIWLNVLKQLFKTPLWLKIRWNYSRQSASACRVYCFACKTWHFNLIIFHNWIICPTSSRLCRRWERRSRPRWPSRRENRWFRSVRTPGRRRAKERPTTPRSTPWPHVWSRKVSGQSCCCPHWGEHHLKMPQGRIFIQKHNHTVD